VKARVSGARFLDKAGKSTQLGFRVEDEGGSDWNLRYNKKLPEQLLTICGVQPKKSNAIEYDGCGESGSK
jgi:hypothetical protein